MAKRHVRRGEPVARRLPAPRGLRRGAGHQPDGQRAPLTRCVTRMFCGETGRSLQGRSGTPVPAQYSTAAPRSWQWRHVRLATCCARYARPGRPQGIETFLDVDLSQPACQQRFRWFTTMRPPVRWRLQRSWSRGRGREERGGMGRRGRAAGRVGACVCVWMGGRAGGVTCLRCSVHHIAPSVPHLSFLHPSLPPSLLPTG